MKRSICIKNLKRVITRYSYLIMVSIIASVALVSCEYDELPPKTDDSSTGYILPKGLVPTIIELDFQSALKKEYNQAME